MDFNVEEATIRDIQQAFASGELTSRKLTRHYLERIVYIDKSSIRIQLDHRAESGCSLHCRGA
jgi:Asp-tRNA(Asn)/Glu-tRNA(Gln) amidotransferase A subunit family amidase